MKAPGKEESNKSWISTAQPLFNLSPNSPQYRGDITSNVVPKQSMKHYIILLSLVLAFASHATGDSKVILTRAFVPVETTIPGRFNTLEAILPALFSLADQAADKSIE